MKVGRAVRVCAGDGVARGVTYHHRDVALVVCRGVAAVGCVSVVPDSGVAVFGEDPACVGIAPRVGEYAPSRIADGNDVGCCGRVQRRRESGHLKVGTGSVSHGQGGAQQEEAQERQDYRGKRIDVRRPPLQGVAKLHATTNSSIWIDKA